jgi:hypothetical protein
MIIINSNHHDIAHDVVGLVAYLLLDCVFVRTGKVFDDAPVPRFLEDVPQSNIESPNFPNFWFGFGQSLRSIRTLSFDCS